MMRMKAVNSKEEAEDVDHGKEPVLYQAAAGDDEIVFQHGYPLVSEFTSLKLNTNRITRPDRTVHSSHGTRRKLYNSV